MNLKLQKLLKELETASVEKSPQIVVEGMLRLAVALDIFKKYDNTVTPKPGLEKESFKLKNAFLDAATSTSDEMLKVAALLSEDPVGFLKQIYGDDCAQHPK